MGNTIGGKDRRAAKVMKITGETLKFKAPMEAGEVLKDYPGLVLLESESVKHYGVRAKPLGAHQRLEPRRLYFLVELPKEHGVPRRVRSGINMSAKDRLESLMLGRRSASDLSIIAKPAMTGGNGDVGSGAVTQGKGKEEAVGSGLRVRVRLPKGEMERLIKESKDEADAVEKIMRLYMNANKTDDDRNNNDPKNDDRDDDSVRKIEGNKSGDDENVSDNLMNRQQQQWNGSHGRTKDGLKKREKRVSFLAVREGPMQIAVAS